MQLSSMFLKVKIFILVLIILFNVIAAQEQCVFYTTPENALHQDVIGFSLNYVAGNPRVISTEINGIIVPLPPIPSAGDPSPISVFHGGSESELPNSASPTAVTHPGTGDVLTFQNTFDGVSGTYTFSLTIDQSSPVQPSENWEIRIRNLNVGIQHKIDVSIGSNCEGGGCNPGATSITSCPAPVINIARTDGTPVGDPALILPDAIINKTTVPNALHTRLQIANTGNADLNFSIDVITAGSPITVDHTLLAAIDNGSGGSYPYTLTPYDPVTTIPLTFTPATEGVKNASLEVRAEDPGSADIVQNYNLQGTAVTLLISFLLDLSGSMGWSLDGLLHSPPVTDTRLAEAKDRLEEFFDVLELSYSNCGQFALTVFPDPAEDPYTNCHTADNQVPMTDVTAANISAQIDPLLAPAGTGSGLVAYGWTPLTDGLETSTGMFTASAFEKRLLYLLTDGAHNCNAVPGVDGRIIPSDFYAPTVTYPNGFLQDNNICLFAIGMGTNTAVEYQPLDLQNLVNHSALESGTTGFYQADLLSPVDLATELKNALLEGLGLDGIVDPVTSIAADQVQKHKVQVSEINSYYIFLLQWDKSQVDRLDFQLITPDCQIITPDIAVNQSDMKYRSGKTHKAYYIDKSYFAHNTDLVGTWAMVINAENLPEGENETYTYSLITESMLSMKARFREASSFTGDVIHLEVGVSESGVPLDHVVVTAEVSYPATAIHNWLCQSTLSQADVDKIPIHIGHEKITRGFQKYLTLKNNYNKEFRQVTQHIKIQLYDDGTHDDKFKRDGIFTGAFTRTVVPGLYTFNINALGTNRAGNIFTRNIIAERNIDVNVSPDGSDSPVKFAITDTIEKDVKATVTIIPKDKFGNYLGLDREKDITLSVQDGRIISDGIIADPNGGYSTIIQFNPDKNNPLLDVQLQGKRFQVPFRPIQPPVKRPWIILFTGFTVFDHVLPLDDNMVYGLRLGYPLTKMINTEVELGATKTKDKLNQDGTVWQINGNILYDLFVFAKNRIHTYGRFGAGVISFNDFSATGASFSINFGAGIYYPLDTAPFGFRFDLGDYLAFTNPFNKKTSHNLQITLGIKYTF